MMATTDSNMNLLLYGAKGDGVTDDTTAIQNVIDTATRNGGAFITSPGGCVFKISKPLLFEKSNRITFDLNGSKIVQSADNSIILGHNCTNMIVRNLEVTYNPMPTVRSSDEVINFYNSNAAETGTVNLLFESLIVNGGKGAGILFDRGKFITVRNCEVKNTLADGIHFSRCIEGIFAYGNYVHDVGDDGIAIVSYGDGSGPCTGATISGNDVENGKARGIAIVGGENIEISSNSVINTVAMGIAIAKEGGAAPAYPTYGVKNISVTGNTIRNAGQLNAPAGKTRGHGILISAGGNCLISSNIIENSLDQGVFVEGATGPNKLAGNIIYDGDYHGIYVLNSPETEILYNSVFNNRIHGILVVTGSHRSVIKGNLSKNNAASAGPYRNLEMNNCNDCQVANNLMDDTRGGVDMCAIFNNDLRMDYQDNIFRKGGKTSVSFGGCTFNTYAEVEKTATAATAGRAALPSKPAGFIVKEIVGIGTVKIPYYNE